MAVAQAGKVLQLLQVQDLVRDPHLAEMIKAVLTNLHDVLQKFAESQRRLSLPHTLAQIQHEFQPGQIQENQTLAPIVDSGLSSLNTVVSESCRFQPPIVARRDNAKDSLEFSQTLSAGDLLNKAKLDEHNTVQDAAGTTQMIRKRKRPRTSFSPLSFDLSWPSAHIKTAFCQYLARRLVLTDNPVSHVTTLGSDHFEHFLDTLTKMYAQVWLSQDFELRYKGGSTEALVGFSAYCRKLGLWGTGKYRYTVKSSLKAGSSFHAVKGAAFSFCEKGKATQFKAFKKSEVTSIVASYSRNPNYHSYNSLWLDCYSMFQVHMQSYAGTKDLAVHILSILQRPEDDIETPNNRILNERDALLQVDEPILTDRSTKQPEEIVLPQKVVSSTADRMVIDSGRSVAACDSTTVDEQGNSFLPNPPDYPFGRPGAAKAISDGTNALSDIYHDWNTTSLGVSDATLFNVPGRVDQYLGPTSTLFQLHEHDNFLAYGVQLP